MNGDLEERLARAGRIDAPPVDATDLWARGRRRARRTRTVVTTLSIVAVLAVGTPVALTVRHTLNAPHVDVANAPAACPQPAVAGDPGATLTRGEGAREVAAAIEAAGGDLPANPPDRFVDAQGATKHALDQLAAAGVVAGKRDDPTHFGAGDPLTRGHLATLLVRGYALVAGHALDQPAGNPYRDDDTSPHESDLETAAAAGLLDEQAPGTIGAFDPVTAAGLTDALARFHVLVTGACP